MIKYFLLASRELIIDIPRYLFYDKGGAENVKKM